MAQEKLINLLLGQNFYIGPINKDYNIISAFKLSDFKSGKLIIQAVITHQNLTKISLIGHYALSNEGGPYYAEARNSRRVMSNLDRSAFLELKNVGLAYSDGSLTYEVIPTAK